MIDYKFRIWETAVYEKDPKDIEGLIRASLQPDLVEFIRHHIEEVMNASNVGISDDRWGSLPDRLTAVLEALQTDGTAKIAKAFYELGRTAERLNHPPSEEQLELYKAKVDKQKRDRPIYMLNQKKKFIKQAAQNMAAVEWIKDKEQKIRLAAMCEIIYSKLVDSKEFTEMLPDLPIGLKPWLRPIAPDWAKKGGRPKK